MIKKLTFLFLILILLLILFVSVFVIRQHGYFFTYQVSTSMPQGFYFVRPVTTLQRGNWVVFYPPSKTKNFLLRHHWLTNDGLMMKEVEGVPGDSVCKRDGWVWINHYQIAPVYRYYALGKLLPNKAFCGRLHADQYLLMSTHIKRSFDGRYFGPVTKEHIVGLVRH